MLAQLKADYPEDVRVAYRHFPLVDIHDKALLATQASEAAGFQGKFWEMHDLLFEQQDDWTELSEDEFETWVVEQAEELGLDGHEFAEDLTSRELVILAQDAHDRNVSIGMPGTPFLVMNGSPYGGPRDYENLEAVFKATLLEKRQFSNCPPMNIDSEKEYLAVLETEKGQIVIELFADKAPMAVNNFIFLAQEGWYNNVTFHRVLEGFVAQSGDPSGTGLGGPGYVFESEISPDLVFDEPGILAMANAGPDTNGSQFFITYSAAPQLNGGYTIFGRVISGMDVVEKLDLRNPSLGMGQPPGDLIFQVTIEER